MNNFADWVKNNRVLLTIIIGLMLIIVGMAIAPSKASALELNAAREVLEEGLAGTTPELLFISAPDSVSSNAVMSLPNAYMVWELVGNPIQIRRFYANVAETNWIAIPDGQSLIIPAPPPFKRTGSVAWWHKMAVKGAASDTVKYLPMDR
jgi:hypothetical protein